VPPSKLAKTSRSALAERILVSATRSVFASGLWSKTEKHETVRIVLLGMALGYLKFSDRANSDEAIKLQPDASPACGLQTPGGRRSPGRRQAGAHPKTGAQTKSRILHRTRGIRKNRRNLRG
jgi:hypothetical protein